MKILLRRYTYDGTKWSFDDITLRNFWFNIFQIIIVIFMFVFFLETFDVDIYSKRDFEWNIIDKKKSILVCLVSFFSSNIFQPNLFFNNLFLQKNDLFTNVHSINVKTLFLTVHPCWSSLMQMDWFANASCKNFSIHHSPFCTRGNIERVSLLVRFSPVHSRYDDIDVDAT